MNDTAFDTPPVFLRPAVDDAFFGRGDFELRQEEFRAVVRVTPRRRTHPAHALPMLLEDMPTEPIEIALPDAMISDDWYLPADLIPTQLVDVPNPVEVLPAYSFDDLPATRERVGTFKAFSRAPLISWDDVASAPWDDDAKARSWHTFDAIGLPAVIAAVAGIWAAALLML